MNRILLASIVLIWFSSAAYARQSASGQHRHHSSDAKAAKTSSDDTSRRSKAHSLRSGKAVTRKRSSLSADLAQLERQTARAETSKKAGQPRETAKTAEPADGKSKKQAMSFRSHGNVTGRKPAGKKGRGAKGR
jgi:hypothetical protein